MQVYIVVMLVRDDSDDNTQNIGCYATRALADAAVEQHAAEGLDCVVEEFPLVS
jgi:hypothetical protein